MTAICIVDVDDSIYLGSDTDGVYYGAALGAKGWYVSALVDCNSGHWLDALLTDDGPYSTEADALDAGRRAAIAWCRDNDVQWEDTDPRERGDDDGVEYGDPRDHKDGLE